MIRYLFCAFCIEKGEIIVYMLVNERSFRWVIGIGLIREGWEFCIRFVTELKRKFVINVRLGCCDDRLYVGYCLGIVSWESIEVAIDLWVHGICVTLAKCILDLFGIRKVDLLVCPVGIFELKDWIGRNVCSEVVLFGGGSIGVIPVHLWSKLNACGSWILISLWIDWMVWLSVLCLWEWW